MLRPGPCGEARRPAGLLLTVRSPATIAAGVLALSLFGDSLFYAVLPAHAGAFGVSGVWLGVLLSVNRFARLGLYDAIATAFRWGGERRLVVSAAVLATMTTLLYAIGGLAVLVAARVLWGLAFAVLSLAALSSAASSRGTIGRDLGVTRALSQVGPLVALGLGSRLVGVTGPRGVFVVMGAITALAIPLALSLPRTSRKHPLPSSHRGERVRGPDLILFGLLHLAEAAILTGLASFLQQGGASVTSVLGDVALLLVARRLLEVGFGPPIGRIAERLSPRLILSGIFLIAIAGLVAIAAGLALVGAYGLVISRAALAVAGPLTLVRRKPHDSLRALAAWATWTETGAAFGPIVATAAKDIMYN